MLYWKNLLLITVNKTMPELPEVETIRRDLVSRIVNKKITSVEVKKPKLVKNKLNDFINVLEGNKINNIKRRGKLLVFVLKNKRYLLIHLKMTGQLIFRQGQEIAGGGHPFAVGKDWQLPNQYSHIIFTFNDGSQLFFNDMRQFGYLKIVKENELLKILDDYGIEPLTADFTLNNFKDILVRSRTAIKALLMNQKLIAGLGNIYASEVCFFAKVKPARPANSLNEKEIKDLYNGCKVILKKAIIKKGTTFNNYVDASNKQGNFSQLLQVYGRAGEKCRRCKKGVIIKIKTNNRSTYYCDRCQY